MATVMLPIDPDKKDDIYYRYKMPAVQVKVEGSGNGIKTVIPNIHDICSALNRPEEVLMKFFQFELGAQSNIAAKDDKYLIMGKHTDERMQELIYSFIRKFVLCTSCRNPETAINLYPKRKEQVAMKCGACGAVCRMDVDDRAYSIMCQHYMRNPEKAKSGKGTAEGRAKENGDAGAEEGPAAATASAKDATAAKKNDSHVVQTSDIADNRRNPNEVAAEYMREAEAESAASSGADAAAAKTIYLTPTAMERLTGQLVRLVSKYNLEEHFAARLVLGGLFVVHKDRLLAAVKAYAPLLRRLATVAELFFRQETFDEKTLSALLKREAKIQRYLIVDAALMLSQAGPSAADKMPVLAFQLFIEGIVKDASILTYASSSKVISGVDPELDAAMKKNTMAVVEWLGVKSVEEKPAEATEEEGAEKEMKEKRKKGTKLVQA